MKRLLLPLLVIILFFEACTKTTTVPPGPDGMLRTGKWKISTSMVTLRMPNGKPVTVDYGGFRKACIKDNYLKFDSLNRGAVHNNGVSCSAADADSVGFIWAVKSNGTKIDLLGCYGLIDSVAMSVITDATTSTGYNIMYDTAVSYLHNIYNGGLTNLTQSSFILEYDLPAHYPDTTAAKGGSPTAPVILNDTFHFHITYTNF